MGDSFDQSSVQRMNRCTGPAPCLCAITGPHHDDNPYCPRNTVTNAPRSISEPPAGVPASDGQTAALASPGAAAPDQVNPAMSGEHTKE